MRVAHIITRMIVGGAQENTLLTCQDLIDIHGDEVLLITGPSLGPEGDLLAEQGGGRVPTQVIPALRRAIHPLRDMRAYYDLKHALARFKPDVVHTHSAKGGMLGRQAAWRLRVPAVVHTVHGAPFHPYQSWLARALFRACERHAAGRCHQLVSVADAMTKLMVEAGVAPPEKFVTVYSGMDIEPFYESHRHREATRAALGFDAEHVVVGKIARLFRLKGHADVIAAARRVVEVFPQVRFLFVGDGILRDACQRQIAQAGLTPYFVFTGLVSPARIPEMISAMDVLVHASLREGLARALPQALIAGKPVVSYDVDGAAEVVLPGVTGCLVPPRSVEGLQEALLQLVGDAALRARLGAEGRRRFAAQFDHRHMTRCLREIYQRLLAQASAAP